MEATILWIFECKLQRIQESAVTNNQGEEEQLKANQDQHQLNRQTWTISTIIIDMLLHHQPAHGSSQTAQLCEYLCQYNETYQEEQS